MAAQNIRYREITITPYTHIEYMDKGLKIEEILEGLEAGRKQAQEEFGVEIRWVFDVPRNLSFPKRDGKAYDPEPAKLNLDYALKGRDFGVVGYGLGGYEVNAPPEPFAHAFVQAREHGLLSVPHAGETEGPASVWGSVRDLKADRIGHGVRAWDDPELVSYLKENQIPLEINPTSNICLHVYEEYADHPFRKLDESGVIVTVNSDDPPLFNTALTREYIVLAQDFGYDQVELARIGRNAFVHAGVEEDVKKSLLEEFDGWVEENLA
jgi:adenosine deaminase